MPITVEAPDGAQVEFPDSMSHEDIEKVMQEHYPSETPSKGVKSLQDVGVNPQQYIAGAGGMSGISLIPPPGPAGENPLGSYIPETPDIQAETIPGQLAAAPINFAKHLGEGIVSPLGVATLGLGPIPKAAQSLIGAGFGLPQVWEGAKRVYRGAALGEPREVIEGGTQALGGGLITGGAVHGAMPERALPKPEPPVIPPPKLYPPETVPINLEPPPERPPIISEQAPPSVAPEGLTVPASGKPIDAVWRDNTKRFLEEGHEGASLGGIERVNVSDISPSEEHGYAPKSLIDHIQKGGALQPVVLERYSDGSIHIVDGSNRVNAAADLGVKDIPARFIKYSDNQPFKVEQQAPPSALPGEVKPSAAPVSEAVEAPVTAGATPQAMPEPSVTPPVTQEVPPVIGEPTAPPVPPGAPPIIQAGAAHIEEIQPTPTALKNASGDAERLGLGLRDAPEIAKGNIEVALAKAATAEEQSPGIGANLAEMVKRDPKMGLSDVEAAILLRHKVDLFNKMNDAAEASNVGDAKARATAQALHDGLKAQYEDLLDAVRASGSRWGTEGRWRQVMLKEDFTMTSADEMNRYSKVTTGKELPGEKVAEAEKKSKAVKTVQDEADVKTDKVINDITSKANTPPKLKTPSMMDAEKRAFDAANKTVREWAVKRADNETVARIDKAKSAQEIYEIQRDTAQKALDAANETVRENAKRVADAESRARVAKSAKERNDAINDRRVAQKATAIADAQHRQAVIAMVKAQRALQDNPIKAVWDKIREYIQKGMENPDDIRTKVATDLGMKVDHVTRIMAQDVKTKRLMDDAWLAQQKAQQMRQAAKRWVQGLNTPGYEKALAAIPRSLFAMKVFGHGTVALGTHAPSVAFQPKFLNVYMRDFGKMYKMVASPAFYEQQVRDLVRDPLYIKAKRAGAIVDPGVHEDFTSPETAKFFGNLAGAGNRGYTILKILRMDMFRQMYNKLPRSMQVQDSVAEGLAKDINSATGVSKVNLPPGSNLAFFAPRLQISRVNQLLLDPIQAARTFANWKNASAGDKLFAQNQVKQKLWIAGTLFSALAANQGLLTAMGSKQKINGIPESMGGAGFDPLASDFLKFKIYDHDVAYGSAILNMMKLPVRLAYALAYEGKGSKYVHEDERWYKILGDFARSQASPFAGAGADLMFGRDFQGRPLPRAGFGLLPGKTDIPKRLRMHGITTPYSWTEYGMQQAAPIPVAEFLKEVWGKGLGMSDAQIEQYFKAFLVGSAMAGTGSRITEDKNIEQPQ